jgi:hypothetical protein
VTGPCGRPARRFADGSGGFEGDLKIQAPGLASVLSFGSCAKLNVVVLVAVIILIFVGFKWVKPESLGLKVWNWLEFEMRGPDKPEPPKRAIKTLVIWIP